MSFCSRQWRLKSFLFSDEDSILFVKSQWGSNLLPYAIYRTVIFLYILTTLVYAPIESNNGADGKFMIFLTYWSFIVMVVCYLVRMCNVWFAYRCNRAFRAHMHDSNVPWFLQLQWILYTLSVGSAFVTSALFWGLVFGPDKELRYGNFSTHGSNSIIVVLDLFITAHPFRFLHLYVLYIYGIVYGAFTAIYWAAGGEDELGFPYIYKQIDWGSNPGSAAGYLALFVFVGSLIAQLILFGLYSIRILIWTKCCSGKNGVVDSNASPGMERLA